MTRLLIFVTLLGVQFARGISENVVTVQRNQALLLHASEKENVSMCLLRTNTGEEYEYEPICYEEITDRISVTCNWRYSSCSIRVSSLEFQDAGEWKITTFYKQNGKNFQNEDLFLAHIKEHDSIFPDGEMKVQEGNFVYGRIATDLTNITACNVTMPNGTTIDMFTVNDKYIEYFGPCGFRVLANATYQGKWSVLAVVRDLIFYDASTYIYVEKDEFDATEMQVVTLQRDSRGTIKVGPSVTFCQLQDPNHVMTPLTYGSCTYEIDKVSTYHEGIWTAYYGLPGGVHTKVFQFKVDTYDHYSFKSSVNVTESGHVKLLCQVHAASRDKLGYCRFTRPDDTVLNISPGIGTEQYSAYKVAATSSSTYDVYCGLVIHKPSILDYGSWRCDMSLIYAKDHYGSLLHVVKSKSTEYNAGCTTQPSVEIRGQNSYVKYNDTLKIKCIANVTLDYCWFRSPNGTAYSVSYGKSTGSPYTLPYEGAGLSFGECGARIDNAVYTDHGEWTCNLGVGNSTEEAKAFSVFVTDSYLLPGQKDLALTEENTELSCYLLPNLEQQINYCRWVRPDGYGIGRSVSHRYTIKTSNDECKIILHYTTDENIGRWTCVASVVGSKTEEAWTSINVHSGSLFSSALIGVFTTGCILLAMSACVYVLISMRKRRHALPKNPPAYSLEAQPRCVKSHYPSKEFQY